MVLKLILLYALLIPTGVVASDVTQAFGGKKYDRVSEIYRDNPARPYSDKELIYISYALRKLGFYRQDIKLNIRIIKKKYASKHKRLLDQVQRGDTVDSDEYPESLKVLYWNLMNDYGKILESYKTFSTLIKKDHQHYLVFSKLLAELEFRERQVDKFNDKILAHIKLLEDKVYKLSSSLSFQYISWQTLATLKGPSSDTGLIITNRGLCAGGDIGYENAFYHFYFDGCAFAGTGGVSADSTSAGITYRQSNVSAFGIKAGPGASMIVSSSGSRIGVRLPVIYTMQKLQDPQSAIFNIQQINPISYVASLYSRWQFKNWYFQTEFGHYIQNEQTFWGLGIGKKF